MQLFYLR
jgi:hypothetical protein